MNLDEIVEGIRSICAPLPRCRELRDKIIAALEDRAGALDPPVVLASLYVCMDCGMDLTPTPEQLEALMRFGNPLRRQPCLKNPSGMHRVDLTAEPPVELGVRAVGADGAEDVMSLGDFVRDGAHVDAEGVTRRGIGRESEDEQMRSSGPLRELEDRFPHPAVADPRDVDVALQAAVDEIEALRLMSYTGGQADLGVDDVRDIRRLLINLVLLLDRESGVGIPEPGVIL